MTRYTDMIDGALIRVAAPELKPDDAAEVAAAVRSAAERFEIDRIRRIGAFIGQMAHESQGFTRFNENLNYSSAKRIRDVFGSKRFPTLSHAQIYVNRPEMLANLVYANRMGNGPPESGDGWRFRGGGPMQLTGRNNWQGFADAIGKPLDEALTYGRSLAGGIMAAAWFWEENDINRLADTPGVNDETRRINGGEIGLADRKRRFDALVAEMLRRERTAA